MIQIFMKYIPLINEQSWTLDKICDVPMVWCQHLPVAKVWQLRWSVFQAKKSAKYNCQQIFCCNLEVNIRRRISQYVHYNFQWNCGFDFKKSTLLACCSTCQTGSVVPFVLKFQIITQICSDYTAFGVKRWQDIVCAATTGLWIILRN